MRPAGNSAKVFCCVALPLSTLVWVPGANAQLGGPSFGWGAKKTVTLRSKLPPIFDARGKSVQIQTRDGVLTIAIERQLTQSDSTIKVGGTSPDLLIECTVSQSHLVALTRANESGSIVTRMIGDLSIIFRISEPRSKLVVKSDIATAKVNEVISKTAAPATAQQQPVKIFGKTMPNMNTMKIPGTNQTVQTNAQPTTKPRFATTDEAQSYLVNDAARQIAAYLVNTTEVLTIPLAVGGALNGPDKFAVNGLWSRYREALGEMQPFSDAKQEGYRQYDIGVANEGQAYDATENKAAMKYLEAASIAYGKALDANPGEQAFLDSQGRIKAALEHYEDIGKTTPLSTAAPMTSSLGERPAAPAEDAMSNNDVIDMVTAHLDEKNILDTIQNAPSVSFDLSPKGQIALSKAGVNGNIIMAMKNRTRNADSGPVKRR
jgi:hypothetical protein